jgi:hypothetical protein
MGTTAPRPSDLKLGQRVRYTNGLQRRTTYDDKGWQHAIKRWEPLTFDSSHPEHKGEGIVVGLRTLANGRRQWLGEEEGYAFHAEERFTAAVISHSLRAKPVVVRIDDVEPIEEAADGRE